MTVIGVPLDLGQGRRGVDMGPSSFRAAELHDRIAELGWEAKDAGDIDVPIQETQSVGDPKMKYLKEIKATCERLRDKVDRTLASGSMPIALGGDHSIAMGTIAGVSRYHRKRKEKVGLIWFDAHGDHNTPETSPTGNIHGMPCAIALGLGPAALTKLAGAVPMIEGSRAAMVGLRDIDIPERKNIATTGIRGFTMRDIDERGMRTVMEEAIRLASNGTAGIHVSFDLDAIDPDLAPGVGTPSPGGLSYREAHLAMEMLSDTGKVLSAEFVEVNPILDERNGTARFGVGLICSLLGKKIL